MTGNGKRAARRCKELSRPLETGESFWADSDTLMRRIAHRVNRRAARNRLAEEVMDYLREGFNGIADAVYGNSQEIDWMPLRARSCRAVHVSSGGRVFFLK